MSRTVVEFLVSSSTLLRSDILRSNYEKDSYCMHFLGVDVLFLTHLAKFDVTRRLEFYLVRQLSIYLICAICMYADGVHVLWRHRIVQWMYAHPIRGIAANTARAVSRWFQLASCVHEFRSLRGSFRRVRSRKRRALADKRRQLVAPCGPRHRYRQAVKYTAYRTHQRRFGCTRDVRPDADRWL